MSADRTAWHALFAALIEERRATAFDVQAEVALTQQPQKTDLLVLRKRDAEIDDGRVLRGLWPRLTDHTLIEFKSLARPPRLGTWNQLYTYGGLYRGKHIKALEDPAKLTLALAAPSKTPTVDRDAKAMGWTFEDLSNGYYRLHPDRYQVYFVDIRAVAQAERDRLLAAFGHRNIDTTDKETVTWMTNHTMGTTKTKLQDLEGYDEIIKKLIDGIGHEKLLAMVSAEARVAGLEPEDRMAGLKPEETVLALPIEVLRGLSREYIESLPESIQRQLRHRLQS